MKVIGISASPRKEKHTEMFLNIALTAIEEKQPKIKTSLISLGGKRFNGCISCDYCRSNFACSQKDDLYPVLEQLKDAEIKGILLASPVYMGGMTSQAKAFLDRSVLFRRNGFLFKDKVAAAIAVGGSRNGGQDLTLMSILASFMIHDMIIVSDGSPTAHFGGTGWERVPEGPQKDQLAIDTMKNTGYRVADLIGKLYLKD